MLVEAKMRARQHLQWPKDRCVQVLAGKALAPQAGNLLKKPRHLVKSSGRMSSASDKTGQKLLLLGLQALAGKWHSLVTK